jgi:uncharacterized membrane protein
MRRSLKAGATFSWLALAAVSASATEPAAPASDQDLLWRTFYQTATYQALSSLDDFAFGYFFAGGAAAGSILALTNAVTEAGVNYVHDLAWAVASDSSQSASDTRTTRTVTYTAANAARVFGLGLMITGDPTLSLGYVAFNAVADGGAYAANDMAWERLRPVTAAPNKAPSWTPFIATYLPDIRLVIREVPAERRMTIREVPSTDGSLFRIVYLPPTNEK